MQGKESSSITKATIGKGNISIDEILNDETKIANLNRDINNSEQNKRDVITSDFDAELKIDLRLIASVGNLAVGNTDKAAANWDSYATQTKKGANITYDALAIPLNSLSEAISGDVNVSDALLTTGKNYQNLYQLAYNQNIVLTDLAGEGNLITYNGNQLDSNAQSRYANGFYDRNSDTLAINADSNKNDSILAGSVAHEGAHRMFYNNGQAYTNSEENASHMIGDFAESRWNTYQSGNTSLRDSLLTSTLNFSNNFYANNVEFGDKINPLRDSVIVQNMIKNQDSFGPRWIDPKTGIYSKIYLEGYQLRKTSHQGNDLSAPAGKIINSAFEGKVIASRVAKGYGNTVVVEGQDPDNGQKIWALYGHMQQPSTLKAGDPVKKGTVINLIIGKKEMYYNTSADSISDYDE
jgi:murein DD-endopeptidase MepM/ murein hydrolase activator NlpD